MKYEAEQLNENSFQILSHSSRKMLEIIELLWRIVDRGVRNFKDDNKVVRSHQP